MMLTETMTETTAGSERLTAADLYGFAAALKYVNARLAAAGERPLSMAGFRRHVYGPGDGLLQLEPLPLSMRARADGPDRSTGVIFTRRMLDEYLANRAHNAGYGVERVVTRPTADERAQVMGLAAALAYVNEALARRGASYGLPEGSMGYFRRRGMLAARPAGRAVAYTAADLDAFADALVARWGVEGSRDGRPRGG